MLGIKLSTRQHGQLIIQTLENTARNPLFQGVFLAAIGDRLHDSPDVCAATLYEKPEPPESANVAILRADPRLEKLIHEWPDLLQSIQDCILLLTGVNQHTGQ